jgi:hypothetical protein
MNNSHPSEKEIQQYAVDQLGCDVVISDHVESCEYCMAEVKAYWLLFSEINQQPKQVFDFNVADLVIPELPVAVHLLSAERFIAGFLVLFISCFIGIPVFLFRSYVLNMFSGIPPFFIYAIICSAFIIVLLQSLEMYKKYQKEMRILNFN